MKSFDDSNQGKLVTEVFDKDGNLLWRLTREYGEVLPTEEAMALEQALLDLGKSLAGSA